MRVLLAAVLLAFLGLVAIYLRTDDREIEVQRFGERVELLSREAVLHRTAHAIHIDTGKHGRDVQIQGSYAYLVSLSVGVHVIDISDPVVSENSIALQRSHLSHV